MALCNSAYLGTGITLCFAFTVFLYDRCSFVFILILFVHLRNALLLCVLTCRLPLYTCFECRNKRTVHHFHNNVPQYPIML